MSRHISQGLLDLSLGVLSGRSADICHKPGSFTISAVFATPTHLASGQIYCHGSRLDFNDDVGFLIVSDKRMLRFYTLINFDPVHCRNSKFGYQQVSLCLRPTFARFRGNKNEVK